MNSLLKKICFASIILNIVLLLIICLVESTTKTEREIETIDQVRTVFVREFVEVARQSAATERIVERRVVEACPRCSISRPECPLGDASAPTGDGGPGRIILDERIVERAVSQSERLRFDGDRLASSASTARSESERAGRSGAPRWRASALIGASWPEASPIYGLGASVRLVGPLELGAWGAVDRTFRGAAGLSVGIAW